MLNDIHRRARRDLATAVIAYLCVGSWLAFLSSSNTGTSNAGISNAGIANAGIGVLAVGAGTAVLGCTCASVLRRKPQGWSPADRITLLRAALVACCATLAVTGVLSPRLHDGLLLIFGCTAFALDAVDGPVARRTRSASSEGARLDTQTDAALTLVLSFAAAAYLGGWALLTGLMYYAFSAAGSFRPALRKALPVSRVRKSIGGLQPFALLFALLPGIPVFPKTATVLIALALLSFSFGRDVFTLERMYRATRSNPRSADVLDG